MFRIGILIASMLALVAAATFAQSGKKRMQLLPESCLLGGVTVACIFIPILHFCSGGEALTKQIMAFVLLPIAIVNILIDIDAKASSRLALNLIKAALPVTLGIGRCKLELTA